MAQKRKQYVKLADGTLEQQYIATSADIVEIEAITGITATDVQGALEELKDLADNGGVTSVNNKTGAVTLSKSDVGLGNVNNTSDANKPVSTAQAAAIKVVQDQVTTLVGSDTNKSVRTIANEELASQLIADGADESLNTLQEIAQWIQDHPDDVAAMNKQIADNTSDITKIKNGTTTVGNASKLGGVEASKYAKLTDIPRGELFVITGSAVDSTVSETYNEIVAEFCNGKIPVLKYTYAGDDLVYNFAYFDEEKVVFIYTTDYARVSIVNVNANGTVTERTMLPLITVDDSNGSGPIIDSITKNVADVSVTRRAMQNSDLPNSGVTAGVYSAVQVNSKGVVTAGNQLVEWGTDGQTTPSASLAVGGLFFMKV